MAAASGRTVRLWAWGANSHGQLGLGYKSEQVDRPVEVPLEMAAESEGIALPDGDWKFAAGGGHTVILITTSTASPAGDGQRVHRVMGVGDNGRGQLGDDLDSGHCFFRTLTVPPAPGLRSASPAVVRIFCGWDWTMLVLDDGRVLAAGSNAYGQLGIGGSPSPSGAGSSSVKAVRRFTPVDFGDDSVAVVDVSCGMRHSLFLDSEGRVYASGCGKKGQLGLGEGIKSSGGGRPLRVPLPGPAVSVHCGQNFSLVQTKEPRTGRSRLFGFGDNKHFQILQKRTASDSGPEPAPRSIFDPVEVVQDALHQQNPKKALGQISVGWAHVVATMKMELRQQQEQSGEGPLQDHVDDNDVLLCWGRGDYGQLGGAGLEGIKSVSSGYEHVLAVTSDDRLVSWGWNEHGNCGIPTDTDHQPGLNVWTPCQVRFDVEGTADVKVLDCSAGSGHSFALTT